MKKKLLGIMASVGLVLAMVLGMQAASALQAHAAPACSGAVCMYKDADFKGTVLVAPHVSGCPTSGYSNLKNQGFNDVMSSVNNVVGYTQYFYSDANYGGYKSYLDPYSNAPNLKVVTRTFSIFGTMISWNDVISSVYWIG